MKQLLELAAKKKMQLENIWRDLSALRKKGIMKYEAKQHKYVIVEPFERPDVPVDTSNMIIVQK